MKASFSSAGARSGCGKEELMQTSTGNCDSLGQIMLSGAIRP
jgi:hypothetical protein